VKGLLYGGKRVKLAVSALVLCLVASAGPALAQSSGKIDTGDTAWVLMASALVMLMTPGLGFFYAGMVRRKNALATVLQSFVMVGVIGVLWIVYGYSLAFGTDHWGLIGSFEWVGFRNVGQTPNPAYAATIPHIGFAMFQAMFAIITPALISGAFAERMRFKSFLLFMIAWFTIVYLPIAHWVWAPGGWLRELGVLDFAGGIVVHLSSGIAALVCAIVLGKRMGSHSEDMTPHNLTMTLVGTSLLWFGWFGFNAGSALAANGIAFSAFLATNTAGSAAAVTWLAIEWWHRGKPTALGAASGAVAGLAAVTPASGFIGPMAAIAIGVVISGISYLAIMCKGKLGYDDSLDVFGVHGMGGIWGVLAVGIFASSAINTAVKSQGLVYGQSHLFMMQLLAVGVVSAYSLVVTFILLKLSNLVTPLRVSKDDEEVGLDISQHGEVGYTF
jgi:ammonium transporter, Amt family